LGWSQSGGQPIFLGLVQVLEGSGGVARGQIGITATDFSLDKVSGTWTRDSEKNGNARGNEGSFNDQLFLANTNAILSLGTLDQQSAHDKAWINGDLSLASDSHPIQSELNTALSQQETSASGTSVVDENSSFQANVYPDGPMISDGTVNVANLNVGFDLSTPGGERAATDFEFLNLKKFPLESLQFLPDLFGQRNRIVGSASLFNAASSLGQSEDQQNQRALQHESSVSSSSATLSRHRWLVKK
jgi:hypothetical protein